MERKAVLTQLKHQNHVSKWGECVYSAQSQKEWGLLLESMFVPFDRWTLIPKKVADWKAFFFP